MNSSAGDSPRVGVCVCHCGIGKCRRCDLGDKLVCVDGSVFTMAQVGSLLESFL